MAQAHTARPQHYTLRGIAIFAGLSANALERIQRRCSWRRYERGEPIVNYLDPSDEVFFITAGEAHVTIYSHAGKVVSFGELGSGEVFGEYAAIDHAPRSASVEARTSLPCRLDARSRIPGNFGKSPDGDASGVNAAREKNSYRYEACL